MMKRTAIFLLAAALALPSFALSVRDEIKANPNKAGGVYFAYPAVEISPVPDVPKGYTPFYASHYGRHGSRHIIKDYYYTGLLTPLRRAEKEGALTPRGKELLAKVDTLWNIADGRLGELTPLGTRQHQGIARRLATAYPQIFADSLAEVTAASTVVMRCAHSMFAFIEGLKDVFPHLNIPRESSQRNMNYLNYQSQESRPYRTEEGPWFQPYNRIKEKNTNPDRLIATVFSDPAFVEQWVNPDDFMTYLYWMAVGIQNLDSVGMSLYDYFTPDELYDLWEIYNFEMYSRSSSYPQAEGMHLSNARNLVRNIVETADSYIAGGKHGATLRFGHDTNITPLTALLGMEGCTSDARTPEELAPSGFANFRISPMASNVQMIFFRNDRRKDDILVRVMLNERDVRLPLTPVRDYYYRWSDLRPYLADLAGMSGN